MQSLVAGLTRLRDRLVSIANSFDLYENVSMYVVTRSAQGETIERIIPNPSVRHVSPQLANYLERVQNVRIEVTSYQVSGISKTYKEESLFRRGAYYVLGGELIGGELVGGIVCDRYPGVELEEAPTFWTLLLKERQK